MEKIRFIMIGLGYMAKEHMKRMITLEEAEVAALVDPSPQAVEDVKKHFPALAEVPHFADFREAISQVKADVAIIISPHSMHFEQGMACLDAGLHVMMEKPFVDGSENAQIIIDHAEKLNKHLVVSYQRHLMGVFKYMRELVQSGELGKINYVCAYQAQEWLRSQAGKWRQSLALACGGQLNDSGSHLVDAVLWITGLEPAEVTAVMENHGTEVDIDSAVTVRFEGGAIATINVVGSATIGWHEDLSIHGEKGTILYRNNTSVHDRPGQLFVAREGQAVPVEVAPEDLPDSSDPIQDIIDLLRGRVQEAAAPSICGLRVARLTEAAWKSAANGSKMIALETAEVV